MFECKKLFQPVEFSFLIAEAEMSITCSNRQFFVDTSNMLFTYLILYAGTEVHSGTLFDRAPPIQPLSSFVDTLSCPIVDGPPAEVFVQVSVKMKKDTLYASAGHEVAWAEFKIPSSVINFRSSATSRTGSSLSKTIEQLMVQEQENGQLIVNGRDFTAIFDARQGGLVSVSHNKEQILGPILPQFSRALTDNDRGGCHGAYLLLWERFGLQGPCEDPINASQSWTKTDDLSVIVKCSFDLKPTDVCADVASTLPSSTSEVQDPSDLKFTTSSIVDKLLYINNQYESFQYTFPTTLGLFRRRLVHQYAAALQLGHETLKEVKENKVFKRVRVWKMNFATSGPQERVFHCELEFHVLSSHISIKVNINAYRSWPCLPRVGLTMKLPSSYTQVEWYGKGPYECYQDRQVGARTGIYESSVSDMFFPYIRPSENGSRTQVRWMCLSSHKQPSIMLSSSTTFHASALPYETSELERACHVHELVSSGTFVNIDHRLMGLGGDDSWYVLLQIFVDSFHLTWGIFRTPSTHDEYLIHPELFTFDLDIHFLSSHLNPSEVYLQKATHNSS